MADVELRLIANNEQYISGIKESQQAFQGFNSAMAAGSKEQEEFLAGVVEGIEKEIGSLGKSEKVVKKTGESFKAELKKIKEELAKMEAAGLDGSEQFRELSIRAGELQDQIGDTAQQIKILASDTKNLDALMSAGEGLAGGFAIAQSAAAMFGASQEEVEEQLLKVQSALGMLNGIQAIANTLNKDSAARVVLAAKAQQLYSLAVGKSTGAMKLFRLALIGTGIGALVVAIGLLIANWDKVKDSVERFLSPNAKLLDQMKDQKKAIEDIIIQNELRAAQLDREIALLEVQEGKEAELFNKRVEKAQLSIKLKQAEIKLTQMELQYNQDLIDNEEKKRIPLIEKLLLMGKAIDKDIEKKKSKNDEINKVYQKQNSELEDLNTQLEIIKINENKRIESAKKKDIEKALEAQKALLKEIEQLSDRAEKARLSMLSDRDRIDEEEKIQLKEIQNLKKHLESITTLTKEQYGQIDILINEVQTNAANARFELGKKEIEQIRKSNSEKYAQQEKYKNDIRALQNTIAEEQLQINYETELAILKAKGASEDEQLRLTERFDKDKLKLKKKSLEFDLQALQIQNEVFKQITGNYDKQTSLQIESLQNQIKLIQNEINNIDLGKGLKKKEFSIWRLLGLDPDSEEGKQAIESIKQSSAIIIDQINQMMSAQLQQAEQNRRLIENRLSEAESSLDKELDLQKQGYANNVDAKRAEIAQLKQERQKAIKEEEKIKKQQLALDSAMQASSLITATANIIKGFSAIPLVGQILAIAAIATMWGTFAAARVKASQLITSESKLEKGGHGDSTGIISGKRHSSGGERFSDHIEVEAGERWGVLNRSASVKYGSLFPEMIDSMNKLKFPGMMIKAGNQIVNIDTKKMSSKLDSIDRGISMLNENISNQSDAFLVGKNRVIKVSKNHTRIIHAKN